MIFNGEASEELNAYVEAMAQEEDVLALREEVRVNMRRRRRLTQTLRSRRPVTCG